MIETDTGGRKVGAVAALVQNLRNKRGRKVGAVAAHVQNLRNKSVDRGSDNMHCN